MKVAHGFDCNMFTIDAIVECCKKLVIIAVALIKTNDDLAATIVSSLCDSNCEFFKHYGLDWVKYTLFIMKTYRINHFAYICIERTLRRSINTK